MKLIYISAARIPSEKAHTYQILQMCDAFMAAGFDVTLLLPKRKNPDISFTGSAKEYYGLLNDFDIITLGAVDILGWAEKLFEFHPKLGGLASRLAYQVTLK